MPSRSGKAAETTARPRALRVHVEGASASRTRQEERARHAASTDSSAHDASTGQRAIATSAPLTYRAVHDEKSATKNRSAVLSRRSKLRVAVGGQAKKNSKLVFGLRLRSHPRPLLPAAVTAELPEAERMPCWALERTADVTILQSSFKFLGLFSTKLNGLVIKIAPAGRPLLVLVNPPRLTESVCLAEARG